MSGFHLPDLGEGLHEAEIVAWHVGPGDHVVADQPLLAVETDKAVVEIPSPQSGHVVRLLAEPGDVVQVGTLLVEFADSRSEDKGAIVGEIPTAPPPTGSPAAPGHPTAPRASPAVRRRARELGVDLAAVTPTGPNGTASLADLEGAARAGGPGGVEPLRGVRRAMAANMARAHAQVVPATVTDDADLGAWADGEDITLRLVRGVAAACAVEPALNMSYLGRDIGRRRNENVNLGMAMDTEDGLFVPVLDDVVNRSDTELRAGLEALKTAVTARALPPEQLRGQTITLSNFGVFGGRYAALVVVPPQVAIVGAGRVRPAVVVVDGRPSVRPVLPLSLTFDHRVVMGGEAARFLSALVADLESPT